MPRSGILVASTDSYFAMASSRNPLRSSICADSQAITQGAKLLRAHFQGGVARFRGRIGISTLHSLLQLPKKYLNEGCPPVFEESGNFRSPSGNEWVPYALCRVCQIRAKRPDWGEPRYNLTTREGCVTPRAMIPAGNLQKKPIAAAGVKTITQVIFSPHLKGLHEIIRWFPRPGWLAVRGCVPSTLACVQCLAAPSQTPIVLI